MPKQDPNIFYKSSVNSFDNSRADLVPARIFSDALWGRDHREGRTHPFVSSPMTTIWSRPLFCVTFSVPLFGGWHQSRPLAPDHRATPRTDGSNTGFAHRSIGLLPSRSSANKDSLSLSWQSSASLKNIFKIRIRRQPGFFKRKKTSTSLEAPRPTLQYETDSISLFTT